MPVRWTVLASGSSGNASLLECGDKALLLDAGLSPRHMATRLAAVGGDWSRIGAVILTHTHADHWHQKTFARLKELGIPLFCHAAHQRELQLRCTGFEDLQCAGLVRDYEPRCEFSPIDGVRCRPLPVSHDGGPTFGFRIEDAATDTLPSWAIGYAADLGSWDVSLVQALADVDILALEFNHDVELQRGSGRASWLISRVLGDYGHLSNLQGAQLLDACLRHSTAGRVRHVIQLHLSRQCNCPSLAMAAAQEVLHGHRLSIEVHVAAQDRVGTRIPVVAAERVKTVSGCGMDS
ncbi:MAG: MBL fold metallo-hydrolase [Planctomycetaceae bacterium]|nr:MBL fold metallo-hydrolase [Planctomycetaceae bacterium]